VSSREWNTAVGSGLLRIGVGACLLRWRRPLAQRLAGASADDAVVPALFGYFGIRDVVVGLVTLASTRPDGDVVKAVMLQGHADATDTLLVAGLMQAGRIPRSRGIGAMAVAGVSAVSAYATAWRLRRTGRTRGSS
jgi:hypothetical protein